MTEPKVKKIKLSELIPDPQNANKGTERGRYMLEHSISTLGAGRSVLVDKNNVLIAGNKTTETAVESGLDDAIIIDSDGTKLIVVRRTDLDLTTDEKAKQLAIADNRTGEISLNWNSDIILDLSDEIDLGGFFTNDELLNFKLNSEEETGEGDGRGGSGNDDEIPEVVESRVAPGDIWQLGRHFICADDCTVEENVRKLLSFVGGRSPTFIWSDAPYGFGLMKDGEVGRVGNSRVYTAIANDQDTDVAVKAVKVYAKFDCPQIWWGANYFANSLPPSKCWIVWDKDHHGMTFADAELAWVSIDSPVRCFRHAWSGGHRDSEQGEKRVHVNQKPVALAEWCFEKYGETSDLVLDPFWGSGISTLAAEKMPGRRTVVAFELSEINCELGIRRWEQLSGEKAQQVFSL